MIECTGGIFFQLQGGKLAPLKFGLFDQIFSFLPKVVALVFTVIFSAKTTKKNHGTCKSDQSQDDGFLDDFLAVRQKLRLHLPQPMWSHFFRSMTKMRKIYPCASRPLRHGLHLANFCESLLTLWSKSVNNVIFLMRP